MPNFPLALPRENWQKHGERASILDFGAKADGVLLFDGAINAVDKTLTSATATFTEALIGLTVWIEDAGGTGVDLISRVEGVNSPTSLEIHDNAVATVSNAEVRIGTDNTSAIQNAFDTLDSIYGRRLEFPSGRYLTTDKLDLRSHQMLYGHGWAYDTYNEFPPSLIMCCANVPVLNNTDLVTGDGWVGGNIDRLSFRGTKRTGSKGLYSQFTLGLYLEKCAFDHFGDQALHLTSGVFGVHIIGDSATNSCLVRTGRTDYVGVFDIAPSDVFMSDCEVAASTSNDVGGEYGGGFIAAIKASGNNSFFRDCMGHHSQVGWYIGPPSAPQVLSHFHGCRADRNQGPGVVIDAYNCTFFGLRVDANSFDSHGGYPGVRIISGHHKFFGPEVDTRGDGTGIGIPENNKLKHAFSFEADGFFPPSRVVFPSVGDAFIEDPTVTCTDEIYHVEPGTQEPVIVSFEKNSATNEYDFLQRKAIDMQTHPIWMSASAGAADTRQWSIATGVSGLDDVFAVVAWDDARSAFTLPFTIKRDETTGAISYIAFKDAVFLLIDSSLSFFECDPLALFKSGINLEQASAATDEKRWGIGTGVGTTSGTGQLQLTAINDAVSAAATFLSVLRTGITIDSINLTGTVINIDGNVVLGNGKYIQFNNNTTKIIAGSGSPEGVVAAVGASLFLDGTNGAVYFKVSGTGNAGWKKALTLDVSGFTANRPVKWNGTTFITDLIDGSSASDFKTGVSAGLLRSSGSTGQLGAASASDIIALISELSGLSGNVQTNLNGLAASIATLQAAVLDLQNNKVDTGSKGPFTDSGGDTLSFSL